MHQALHKHILHLTNKQKNGQAGCFDFIFFDLKSADGVKRPNFRTKKTELAEIPKNDAAGGLRSHDLQISQAERCIAFCLIMSLAP